MKTLLQIALLIASLVAVTFVSSMYTAEAAPKKEQNWCFESIGITSCGYESHKECDIFRDAQADPDATKCFKPKVK